MAALATLASTLHRFSDAGSRHAVEDAFRALLRVPGESEGALPNVKLFVTMAGKLAAAQAKRYGPVRNTRTANDMSLTSQSKRWVSGWL